MGRAGIPSGLFRHRAHSQAGLMPKQMAEFKEILVDRITYKSLPSHS